MNVTANVLAISRALVDVPDNRRYGWDLMKVTRLRPASMYKALHRMEGEGWLESYREDGDPRDLGRKLRRYYVLTDLGRDRARDELAHWGEYLTSRVA